MYQFLVAFTVEPDRRDDFVAAALKTGRDSLADEPGSIRFEVLADETDPNRFYLNEVYRDLDALNAHAAGPHFAAFFAEATAYAQGPEWLMKGRLVTRPAVETAR
ncbi:autoinducer 2-degrading protein [Glycomyces sambucus]|uniref:Autoinducer 2-degrading protein n=1 Tax=Glycomyces sambucus TaxID=380244 RepID=A0A1G9CDB3_9ACTN|nr:putative quinol monooxygenase [Glycomyces sambucus]SDK49661.1 autoinducer 2-degrading protein [Glycomyces sambucus]